MVETKENSNRISLRSAILASLCLQNAGYTLLRKHSTSTENVSSKEVLLVAELLKLVLATYFTLTNETEASDARPYSGLAKLP
jgi:hypothetical protein